MDELDVWYLLIVFGMVLLLLGADQVPKAARSLRQAARVLTVRGSRRDSGQGKHAQPENRSNDH